MIRNIGSRPLIFALLVFVTMLGLFLAAQLPIVGAIMLSFAGVPALLIILAWGGTWFLLYSAITMTLTGLVGNLSLAALLVPMLLVPAAALSGGIKLGFSPLKAIGAALLVATLFSSGTYVVATGAGEKDVMSVDKQFSQQMAIVEKQLAKLEESGDASPEAIETIRENVKASFDYLVYLVPITFAFAWHLVSLAILYIAATRFIPAFGLSLKPLPPFAQWKFDWNLIWFFIAGWFFYYVLPGTDVTSGVELVKVIGANCLAVSRIIYFIAGLSLLFFMFEKYRMGSFARLSLTVLALLLHQAVFWLGIIDVWANFRAAKKPALFPSNSDDGDF
jgi:uncharacterized protein YybS (DUF2232 family)